MGAIIELVHRPETKAIDIPSNFTRGDIIHFELLQNHPIGGKISVSVLKHQKIALLVNDEKVSECIVPLNVEIHKCSLTVMIKHNF